MKKIIYGKRKKCLEIQLREAYGRVTYTYTTHVNYPHLAKPNGSSRLKWELLGKRAYLIAYFLLTEVSLI
ncbi:hypothetical protein Q3C76_12485, partial [Enterococcus faecium]|nr:hypothetical protein [Enterococcus faecium]